MNSSQSIRQQSDALKSQKVAAGFASLARLLNDLDLVDDAMHEPFASAMED